MTSRGFRRLRIYSHRAFWLFGILFALAASAAQGNPDTFPVIGVLLALTLAAVALYLFALRRGQVRSQQELAALMARGPISGDSPLVLFLRSFEVAKAGLLGRFVSGLGLLASMLDAMGSARDSRPSRFDAEEELDGAVGGRALFVAIGDKRDAYGAAKIVIDDAHWQQMFGALTAAAELIFMMPGPSASVLWEMSQLLASDDLLKKSAFIMPREGTRFDWRGTLKQVFSLERHRSEEQRAWEAFSAMMADRSKLALPLYTGEGLCFTLAPDGSQKIADLEGFTRALAKYFARPERRAGVELDEIMKLAG